MSHVTLDPTLADERGFGMYGGLHSTRSNGAAYEAH